jgi:phage major head subunit gpT-like protein
MLINAANLSTLYVAFNAAFQGGFDGAPSQYNLIATTVPSSTGSEEYGWIGQLPNMREWIGDRVINGLASHGYTIKNKSFELTVGVPRESIEDDQYGVYTPTFTEMGRSTKCHPDQLTFGLLGDGENQNCYDGQAFFSTTHPVLDAKGKAQNVSNLTAGAGTPWYVLDLSRALKPIIFQQRKAPNFVARDRETDDNVFTRKTFEYGVDSRGNVGFGFWQMAHKSKATLDGAGLKTAITALSGRAGDYGRPLGLSGTHLVVPGSLEFEARELLQNERNDAGATNVYRNRLQLLVCPWLNG